MPDRCQHEGANQTDTEKQEDAKKQENTQEGDVKEDAGQQAAQAADQAKKQAENTYEDARRGREKSLEDAKRVIEDSYKRDASDSTNKISKLDRQVLVKELEKMEALSEQSGIIRTEVDGIVTDIGIETGNDTLDGKNMTIADLTSGSRFVAQITKEQTKLVQKGDEVILKPGNGADEVTGLTVHSVQEKKENPDRSDVTVIIPGNSMGFLSALKYSLLSAILAVPFLRSFRTGGRGVGPSQKPAADRDIIFPQKQTADRRAGPLKKRHQTAG